MAATATTALLISADERMAAVVRDCVLSTEGLHLCRVYTIDEAVDQLRDGGVGVALLHLRSDDEAQAIRWLREVVASRRPVPTIVVSDENRPEQALVLLRQGVVDYLPRPIDLGRLTVLVDILTLRVRYAAPSVGAARENVAVHPLGQDDPFVCCSSAMERLMEQVQRVTPCDMTILLTGETGTGKTRLARLIHEMSPRRGEPFLCVNCAALSPQLIESELFGHVRGAFTGADRDRRGKLADVGRGTLLLDDVDALSPWLQAKLLRAVDERLFEPVGSNTSHRMQARLIAAGNQPIEEEVRAGRFRADLYYRLNVVRFHLPPLRERRELIAELAKKVMAEATARTGRQLERLTPDALQALEAYPWPGNIRELRNVIERAVALCPTSTLGAGELPLEIRSCIPPVPSLSLVRTCEPSLAQTKAQAELHRITEALRKHSNNRMRAALELGISRVTLYKKLRRYGLV